MQVKNWAAFVATSLTIASQLGSVGVYAQTSQSAAKSAPSASAQPYDWKASFARVPTGGVPRTPDGKPDLQGIWNHATLTPFERPLTQTKTELTEDEATKIQENAHNKAITLRIEPTDTPPGEKTTDAYNTFWRENYFLKVPITSLRTSQIVDPPNGRLPALTEAGLQVLYHEAMKADRPATGPEDRPPDSRCIRPIYTGPAYSGGGTLQIVQNSKIVVVRTEALESQMVYLDGRARPADNIRSYVGSARGHWDGDTLVVESTNFKALATHDSSEQLHLTERWKRLDDLHMLYGYTVDDPGTWTKPWSVEYVMWRMPEQEQLIEYACHEGNVGMRFTLSAARKKDQDEQSAKQNGGQQ